MGFLSRFRQYGNINWTLADQALVSGVNFTTGLLLARYLGLESFGLYTMLWMVVLLLGSIQLALIISPMLSIAPKLDKVEHDIYQSSICMHQIVFSMTSFLLIVSILASTLYNFDYDYSLAFYTAAAAVGYQFQDYIRRYFFSVMRPRVAFFGDFVSYIGQLVAIYVVNYYLGLSIGYVLSAVALTSFLSALVMRPFMHVKFNSVEQVVADFRRSYHFSKWLVGSVVMQWLSGQIFFLLAAYLLGPAMVGVMKSAQNIVAATHVFIQALENIIPVKLATLYQRYGLKGISSYLSKSIPLSLSIVFLFCGFVGYFSDDLLTWLYGDEIEGYGYVLEYFCLVYMVMFMNIFLRFVLRTVEETKIIFQANLVAVLIVPFTIPMIYSLQVTGAMLGMLLSALITFLICGFYLVKRYRQGGYE